MYLNYFFLRFIMVDGNVVFFEGDFQKGNVEI